MKMFNQELHTYGRPMVIAEISCNHRGQKAELFKMIDMAKHSRADAIKIQCYNPDSLTYDNGYILKKGKWAGRNLYEIYKSTCTPLEWMDEIFEYARSKNINLFSSVYDIEGLNALEKAGCPAYKIASFENNDPHFIKKVVSTGKPTIISTGMMTINQVRDLIYRLPKEHNNIAILHCVSTYPTFTINTYLEKIPFLINLLPGIPVGFSDHTTDATAAIASIALGACIIEKHFDGVYDMPSEDTNFSLSPSRFSEFEQLCYRTYLAVSRINDEIPNQETELRRSLHVVKELKAGDVVTEDHVKSLRPYRGEAPIMIEKIIGAKVKVDILPGTPFVMEYLE